MTSRPDDAVLDDPAGVDAALMRRVTEGDQRAFRRLAELHTPRILRLARRLLGSQAEADEVAQDTLVRVWQHAGRWDPERSLLSTWIYTIAYRLCLDRLRRKPMLSLDEALAVPDPSPDALAQLGQAREKQALAEAMAQLPPRQRAALVLFHEEEQSGAEAAGVLGLSLRAFWSLLHRARLAVQQSLPPHA